MLASYQQTDTSGATIYVIYCHRCGYEYPTFQASHYCPGRGCHIDIDDQPVAVVKPIPA